MSSIYLLRRHRYMHVCVSTTGDEDLAVKPQTHLSPSLTTMANFHRFDDDDVVHIGIEVGIGNGHYTICIIWLITNYSPHHNSGILEYRTGYSSYLVP